ncbi:MAG: glycosyltransferase family 2 protein [Bacteroidales bacterium]|nr:glycosyltransferase family 2 protein [Bacteroidales bacterium]
MQISVVVPTYKPESYIYECLLSLKNQDLSHDLFEIILVLNGIQQPYQKEIELFIQENLQETIHTKLIYSKQAGVSNARNKGIEAAKGDYIAFVDDDDIIAPNYLSILLKMSSENSIAVSNVKTFYEKLGDGGDDYITQSFTKNKDTSSQNIFKLRSFLSSSCAKIISKEIIQHRRFDERFAIGEDSLFMFSISDKIKKIYLVNTTYYRRIRPKSASRLQKAMSMKMINTFKLLCSYTKVYIKDIRNYNFLLYASRVVAIIIQMFK